jgi:hypothetical protein
MRRYSDISVIDITGATVRKLHQSTDIAVLP